MLTIAYYILQWWGKNYDEGMYVVDHWAEQDWLTKTKWRIITKITKKIANLYGHEHVDLDFIIMCMAHHARRN